MELILGLEVLKETEKALLVEGIWEMSGLAFDERADWVPKSIVLRRGTLVIDDGRDSFEVPFLVVKWWKKWWPGHRARIIFTGDLESLGTKEEQDQWKIEQVLSGNFKWDSGVFFVPKEEKEG